MIVWDVAKKTVAVRIERLRSWRDKSGAVNTRSVTLTSDGHYVASPGAADLLRWRLGDQLLTADEMRGRGFAFDDAATVARALSHE